MQVLPSAGSGACFRWRFAGRGGERALLSRWRFSGNSTSELPSAPRKVKPVEHTHPYQLMHQQPPARRGKSVNTTEYRVTRLVCKIGEASASLPPARAAASPLPDAHQLCGQCLGVRSTAMRQPAAPAMNGSAPDDATGNGARTPALIARLPEMRRRRAGQSQSPRRDEPARASLARRPGLIRHR